MPLLTCAEDATSHNHDAAAGSRQAQHANKIPQTTTTTTVITQPSEMAVQDDLATLFAKNLTLSQPAPQQQPEDPNKIIYISQHYTHTAHIAQPQPTSAPADDEPMPRPSSEPADLADLELALRAAGVDTSALSLPQAELFRRADDAQRARLVQLWTICPPAKNNNNDHPGLTGLTWSATSLEQEEMLARRRYEAQQQQQQQQQQRPQSAEVAMSLDGTEVPVASLSNSPSSSVQSSDGRWQSVSHAHSYMEPYMASGYEELARREYDASARKAALDPVYRTTGGVLDWERQQWMENQYGSFVGGWRDDEEML